MQTAASRITESIGGNLFGEEGEDSAFPHPQGIDGKNRRAYSKRLDVYTLMLGAGPMTRWNLSISEETDRAVRTFLARNGGKKGDLSRFVDEAVRQRVFDLTVSQVKERNAELDQQEILDLIDDEVSAARAGRS